MAASKLTKWKAQKNRDVTLPSGTEVTIALPNVNALARAGRIPNELMEAVFTEAETGQADNGRVSQEELDKRLKFMDTLIIETVVDPKLELSDLEDIPADDLDMLQGFATRTVTHDAKGQVVIHESPADFQGVRDEQPEHTSVADS